jgi:hypothetical protein
MQGPTAAKTPRLKESNVSQNKDIATQQHQADNVNAGDTDGSTVSFSSTVHRWVGGSVGYVHHTAQTRFVGGCAGSVHGL